MLATVTRTMTKVVHKVGGTMSFVHVHFSALILRIAA
jgi:hypothetical protein